MLGIEHGAVRGAAMGASSLLCALRARSARAARPPSTRCCSVCTRSSAAARRRQARGRSACCPHRNRRVKRCAAEIATRARSRGGGRPRRRDGRHSDGAPGASTASSTRPRRASATLRGRLLRVAYELRSQRSIHDEDFFGAFGDQHSRAARRVESRPRACTSRRRTTSRAARAGRLDRLTRGTQQLCGVRIKRFFLPRSPASPPPPPLGDEGYVLHQVLLRLRCPVVVEPAAPLQEEYSSLVAQRAVCASCAISSLGGRCCCGGVAPARPRPSPVASSSSSMARAQRLGARADTALSGGDRRTMSPAREAAVSPGRRSVCSPRRSRRFAAAPAETLELVPSTRHCNRTAGLAAAGRPLISTERGRRLAAATTHLRGRERIPASPARPTPHAQRPNLRDGPHVRRRVQRRSRRWRADQVSRACGALGHAAAAVLGRICGRVPHAGLLRFRPFALLGALASLAGALVGTSVVHAPLAAAFGADGLKVAAALAAKNIGGGLERLRGRGGARRAPPPSPPRSPSTA